MISRKILPPPRQRIQTDSSMFIVNIVLLLILFFLATGRLMNAPTSDVDLSETEDLPIENLPQPLLTVRDDGSLTVNGSPVAKELLGQALANEATIYLLIPKTSSAADLVGLLAEPGLQSAEIRLVTVHRREGP